MIDIFTSWKLLNILLNEQWLTLNIQGIFSHQFPSYSSLNPLSGFLCAVAKSLTVVNLSVRSLDQWHHQILDYLGNLYLSK